MASGGRSHNSRESFFEVGTGHKPVIPICFFLMGADKFITVDLNRRIDLKLLKGVLNNLVNKRERLEADWEAFTPPDILRERFNLLSSYKDEPELFLCKSGIQYLAPADACSTSLSNESIDCHLSNTVMEHIPSETLLPIVKEAFRILKKGGVAIHFIDLSDHFQHQDSSISEINFLRYSEEEWKRIAGNEFAFTNRLRPSDYFSIFSEVPFTVIRKDVRNNDNCQLNEVNSVCELFSLYSPEEISAVDLRILLKKL